MITSNDFGDSLRARLVVGGGQHRLEPRSLDDRNDLARVGCDHEAIAHTRFSDSAHNPEDEGFACQRQERLARKAAGAQPRRNDAEDGHGGTYKIRAVASTPCLKRLRGCGLGHHTMARAMRRKFSSSCLPCEVPMDSGWNCTP